MANGHRGPQDYAPTDDELLRAVTFLRTAVGTPVNYRNGNGNGNGNGRLLNTLLGIISALSVAGVVGTVAMYGKVSALEAAFNTYVKAHP